MSDTDNNYKDVAFAVIILLVLQTLLAIKVGVFNGLLGGTDVYMWLNRVQALYTHGDWSDHSLTRINPPEGYEQHWTRPYDFLLFAGAWAGSFFTDFKTSLHVWGVLISPILEIFALFAFIWLIKPLTGIREKGVSGILFVTQMGIIASFVAGRADHQSLILLLFILSLGIGLRMLISPFNARTCYIAALISGLAIWVSVESILLPLLMVTAFGVFWLRGDPSVTRKLTHYSVALVLFITIFRLIEFGPSRFLDPALDQLSIVYITLFGMIALYWSLVSGYNHVAENEADTLTKVVSALAWCAFMVILLANYYPGFFAGPMSNSGELFQRVHLSKVKELQPAISIAALNSENWLYAFAKFFLWVGIIIPGIPLLISRITQSHDDDERICWSFIGILCLAYIPLSLSELRWASYTAILMLPGYIWLISRLMQICTNRLNGQLAGLARITILVGSVSIFALPKVFIGEEEGDRQQDVGCPLIPISEFLSNPASTGGGAKNLLAFTDFGPEILYRTPHSVFSIPSHRHHSGFTDSFMIMTAIDDRDAMRLILDREINLILLCPEGHEKHFYSSTEDKPTFHKRLASDDAPEWLERVILPDELAEPFMLYRVRQGEPAKTPPN